MGIAEHLELFTDEQRASQLVFALIMDDLSRHAGERAKQCRKETHRIIECVRDGTATEHEDAAVREALLYINSHSPRPEDKRRLYALAMRCAITQLRRRPIIREMYREYRAESRVAAYESGISHTAPRAHRRSNLISLPLWKTLF